MYTTLTPRAIWIIAPTRLATGKLNLQLKTISVLVEPTELWSLKGFKNPR
jgi:hypothetical protein